MLQGLDYDEKVNVLARLAHFMVCEEVSVLEIERALPLIRNELDRLRKRLADLVLED